MISPQNENGYLAFEVDLKGSFYGYIYGVGSISVSGARPTREWYKDETTIAPGRKDKNYFLDNGMHMFCQQIRVNESSKIYGFRLATHSDVTASTYTTGGGVTTPTFKSWNIVEIKARMSQPETFDVGNLFLTLPMLRFVTLIDGTGKRNVFIRF